MDVPAFAEKFFFREGDLDNLDGEFDLSISSQDLPSHKVRSVPPCGFLRLRSHEPIGSYSSRAGRPSLVLDA
jgi:hypothetical protein